MPGVSVPSVEINRVAGLKGLHQLGKIPLGGVQEQMDMVGQKAITEKLDLFLLAIERQLLQIGTSISVVLKDALMVIASGDDVIDGSGVLGPNRPGHESELS